MNNGESYTKEQHKKAQRTETTVCCAFATRILSSICLFDNR